MRISKPGSVIDVGAIAKASDAPRQMVEREMKESMEKKSRGVVHAGRDDRQVHRASFKPPVDLPVHPPVLRDMIPITVIKNPEPLKHKMTGVDARPTHMPAPKTRPCFGMFSPNLTPPRGDIPLAYIG
jgi:hypothetical protein